MTFKERLFRPLLLLSIDYVLTIEVPNSALPSIIDACCLRERLGYQLMNVLALLYDVISFLGVLKVVDTHQQ